MYHIISHGLKSKFVLKILSVIVGYGIWVWIGSVCVITRQCIVPICFYNMPEGMQIDAPEMVSVTLSGVRNRVYTIDETQCALHCDARMFEKGVHILRFSDVHFFLPPAVSVVHYTPCSITCS